jgi:hypothetical protein
MKEEWTSSPTCDGKIDELPRQHCSTPSSTEPAFANNHMPKQPAYDTPPQDKPVQKPKIKPKPVLSSSSSVSNTQIQEYVLGDLDGASQLPGTPPFGRTQSNAEKRQVKKPFVSGDVPGVLRRPPWTMTSPSLKDIQNGKDVEKLSISQLKSILRESGKDEGVSERDLRSKVTNLLVASHQTSPGGPYCVAKLMDTRKEILDQLRSEEDIKSLSGVEVRRILRKCSVETGSDNDRTLTDRLIRLWLDQNSPTTSNAVLMC